MACGKRQVQQDMQIAVLSDIHANLEAFRRVLEDIESRCPGVDEIISLGDGDLGFDRPFCGL